jgi:predicted Zn-dependent protease
MTRHGKVAGAGSKSAADALRRMARRIEQHLSKEEWAAAEGICREALREAPDDHWFITRLADAVYEQRRYRTALKLYRKAGALAPRCPLVRWGLAGASMACRDTQGARQIYQSIARMRPEVLATQECGEGIRWARGLIADAHYRLGQLAEKEGSKAVARRRYRLFLRGIEQPALSIEDPKKARARLQALTTSRARNA